MDERAKAVQRMQEYIEAHLFETITLADLARASLFSPLVRSPFVCRLDLFDAG